MLGFAGVSVFLAYLFCILVTLVCIIYGAVMWNKDKQQKNGGNTAGGPQQLSRICKNLKRGCFKRFYILLNI